MIRVLAILALFAAVCRAGIVEEKVTHAGVSFRVVRVAPEQVRLVWKDGNGEPYRSFDKVQSAFAAKGGKVVFLMNAGIFEPGGIPSGLHIEGGKILRPINLADAPGNFFLKPNGICTFGKQGPFIGSCAAWKPAGSESWGIQSGPMLLIDGKRHPAFRQDSSSKLHRNGVGVDEKGKFVFAITDRGQIVNFWDFAGLFLQLGCKNALFLDGDISQMAVNPDKPLPSNQFGAMFAVVE